MKRKNRPKRVAELVREEIAGLLTKGLKDPRIGFVSVMSVEMSNDLRVASVYVSFYGTESERKSSLAGLRNSSSWVRREVGQRLKLRFAPEIRFFEDKTLDRVFHLDEVFRRMRTEEGGEADGED